MNTKTIIVPGYFNRVHEEFSVLFEKAKVSGDQLWAIVNCELQRGLKRRKKFVDENERLIIVSAIKYVDKVLIAIVKDKTPRATIAYLVDNYFKIFEIYFANGVYQNNESIPVVPVRKGKRIGLI